MRIRSRYRLSALLVTLGLVPLAMSGSAWAAASQGMRRPDMCTCSRERGRS